MEALVRPPSANMPQCVLGSLCVTKAFGPQGLQRCTRSAVVFGFWEECVQVVWRETEKCNLSHLC